MANSNSEIGLRDRLTVFGKAEDQPRFSTDKDGEVLSWPGEYKGKYIEGKPWLAVRLSDGRLDFKVGSSAQDARHVWKLAGASLTEAQVPFSENYPTEDHFLVPLNADAEEHLRAFVEALVYLSPDHRYNVIDIISRPGLHAQMYLLDGTIKKLLNRLEGMTSSSSDIAGASPAPRSAHGRPSFWEQVPYWVWFVGGGALLLAIVVFGLIFGIEWFSPSPAYLAANNLLQIQNTDADVSLIRVGGPKTTLWEHSSDSDWQKFAVEVLRFEILVKYQKCKDAEEVIREYQGEEITFPDADERLIKWASCRGYHDPKFKAKTDLPSDCNSSEGLDEVEGALSNLAKSVMDYKESTKPTKSDPPLSGDALKLVDAMKNSVLDEIRSLYHTLGTMPSFDQNFAYAVVKLDLFRIKLIAKTSLDLRDANVFTDSKAALSNPANAAQIRKAGKGKLLGWVLCQSLGTPFFEQVSIPDGPGNCIQDSVSPDYIKDGFEFEADYAKTGR